MSWTLRQSKPILLVVMVVLITLAAGVSAAEHTTDGGTFEVEITETNAPIPAGDELVVTATVTNTGETRGSQQIHLKDADATILDSIANPALTLSPGESAQVSLRWQPDAVGTHEISVSSDDQSVSQSVVVGPAEEQDDETESTTPAPSNAVSGGPMAGTAGDDSESTGARSSYLDHSYFRIDGAVANVTGYDVERITFAGPNDGLVTISEPRTLPDGVEPTDDIVGLYDIGLSKQTTVMPATIEFRMAADRFDGADTDDIVVRHWNGTAWNDLDTNATGDENVTIQAETPGFSMFAVTTGGTDDATGAQSENESVDPPAEGNETTGVEDNATASAEDTATTDVEDNATASADGTDGSTSETAGGDDGSVDGTESEVETDTTSTTDTESTSVEEQQPAGTSESAATGDDEQTSDDSPFGVSFIVVAVIATVALATYQRRSG